MVPSKVARMKPLLSGKTERCADASGVLVHPSLLCFASMCPEQSGEWWREEGSVYTGKKMVRTESLTGSSLLSVLIICVLCSHRSKLPVSFTLPTAVALVMP